MHIYNAYTYTDAHTHDYTHMYIYNHIHIYIYTYIYIHIHIYTHACTCAFAHKSTCGFRGAGTYTRTVNTQTHIGIIQAKGPWTHKRHKQNTMSLLCIFMSKAKAP